MPGAREDRGSAPGAHSRPTPGLGTGGAALTARLASIPAPVPPAPEGEREKDPTPSRRLWCPEKLRAGGGAREEDAVAGRLGPGLGEGSLLAGLGITGRVSASGGLQAACIAQGREGHPRSCSVSFRS